MVAFFKHKENISHKRKAFLNDSFSYFKLIKDATTLSSRHLCLVCQQHLFHLVPLTSSWFSSLSTFANSPSKNSSQLDIAFHWNDMIKAAQPLDVNMPDGVVVVEEFNSSFYRSRKSSLTYTRSKIFCKIFFLSQTSRIAAFDFKMLSRHKETLGL